MQKERYIEIAKALCNFNLTDKCFHVTFIVKKRKIVTIGINKSKTHPNNLKYNYYGLDGAPIHRFVGVHSEMAAILKYGKTDCSDCTFINVRIDRNNKVAMSKPCLGCQHLLDVVGWKSIYFSSKNEKFLKFDQSASGKSL
jgi:deoxycytidylate deaminase